MREFVALFMPFSPFYFKLRPPICLNGASSATSLNTNVIAINMKHLKIPYDFFNLFPTETVRADSLKEGDIAYLHGQWAFVLSSAPDDYFSNNGHNISVKQLGKCGGSYHKPGEEVKVIWRDLIDKEKVKELIKLHYQEEEERRKAMEEEEREEKERLRAMRDAIDRELGDYDDK